VKEHEARSWNGVSQLSAKLVWRAIIATIPAMLQNNDLIVPMKRDAQYSERLSRKASKAEKSMVTKQVQGVHDGTDFMFRILRTPDRLSVLESLQSRFEEDANWLFRGSGLFHNHRVCVTKNGFLSLVPCSTEVGAKVAVVHEGRLLYVLRSADLSKGQGKEFTTHGPHSLVGHGYFLDLMDGQARKLEDFAPQILESY
jgi:hypothetical protein